MKPPPLKPLRRHPQQPVEPAFGPAIEPVCEPVSGPSFPLTVKILATALVLALIVFGAMALTGSAQALARAPGASDWGFLAAVTAVVGSGYWVILTSRTGCDGRSIEQTGLRRKRVDIADITQVKLISVPGLSWLVVPRLVVRTGYGWTTFHAGDPAVLSRFKLLAQGG